MCCILQKVRCNKTGLQGIRQLFYYNRQTIVSILFNTMRYFAYIHVS